MKTKTKAKRLLIAGTVLLTAFGGWTLLVCLFDVQAVGVNGTNVGFAAMNTYFHAQTGVNMHLYTLTDWLGLVPVGVCLWFAVTGLLQWIRRKNVFRTDADLRLLGVYYILIFFCYLLFESIPINYRPVLINGFAECSYPSSTTLLVLGVMPTLILQVQRRLHKRELKICIIASTVLFSAFMVIGRTVSGVHWISDIIGSVLLSAGLFCLYAAAVHFFEKKKEDI